MRPGAGAVGQSPLSEREVVFLDRGIENEMRAGSIASHVEHGPRGITPYLCAAGFQAVVIDQVEPPDHVAVKMRVVKNLNIERLSAAVKQQLKQFVGLRLPRRVLLAFSRRSDQRRITSVSGQVKVVGVGSVVQKSACD